jgi:hypothetical protein
MGSAHRRVCSTHPHLSTGIADLWYIAPQISHIALWIPWNLCSMSETPTLWNNHSYDNDCPSDVLPPGWISYTHPEGAQYFFHEEKVRMSRLWAIRGQSVATTFWLSTRGSIPMQTCTTGKSSWSSQNLPINFWQISKIKPWTKMSHYQTKLNLSWRSLLKVLRRCVAITLSNTTLDVCSGWRSLTPKKYATKSKLLCRCPIFVSRFRIEQRTMQLPVLLCRVRDWISVLVGARILNALCT